jgi:hypothetical protein
MEFTHLLTYSPELKWDIVAWRRAASGRVLLRFIVMRLIATAAAATAAASAATTTGTVLSTKHLEPIGGDFQLRVLLAIFFPAIELEPAFDQNGRSFAKILVRDLGRAAPKRDVDESDLIDPLIAAFDSIVHSQADIGDGRAAGDVPQFWIAGQISDEDDSVKACHGYLLSASKSTLPLLPCTPK